MTIFQDTSVEVARITHSARIREKIELAEQGLQTIVGSVVLKEFRNRVLKDARYLLEQFHGGSSYSEVLHRVNRLPGQQRYKKNVCIGLLATLFQHEDDDSVDDRCKSLLKTLIEHGMAQIEMRSLVIREACAMHSIKIKKATNSKGKVKYDFGPNKCEKITDCPIRSFLDSKREQLRLIHEELKSSEELTVELQHFKNFIETNESFEGVEQSNPCSKLGDLLIALESSSVSKFMTLNIKESRLLCKALGQELTWIKTNPEHSTEVINP